jgi:hypothetical protein
MHLVAVREIRQGEEFGTVILFIIAERSEVLFRGVVQLLGLAVGLRVDRCRELVVDAHVGADSSPEWAGELCSTVGDDIVWYIVRADHDLENHTCQFPSVDILSAVKEYSPDS